MLFSMYTLFSTIAGFKQVMNKRKNRRKSNLGFSVNRLQSIFTGYYPINQFPALLYIVDNCKGAEVYKVRILISKTERVVFKVLQHVKLFFLFFTACFCNNNEWRARALTNRWQIRRNPSPQKPYNEYQCK